jgi:hypothetical protein
LRFDPDLSINLRSDPAEGKGANSPGVHSKKLHGHRGLELSMRSGLIFSITQGRGFNSNEQVQDHR